MFSLIILNSMSFSVPLGQIEHKLNGELFRFAAFGYTRDIRVAFVSYVRHTRNAFASEEFAPG